MAYSMNLNDVRRVAVADTNVKRLVNTALMHAFTLGHNNAAMNEQMALQNRLATAETRLANLRAQMRAKYSINNNAISADIRSFARNQPRPSTP
jgi:hypothetical protein